MRPSSVSVRFCAKKKLQYILLSIDKKKELLVKVDFLSAKK